MNHNQHNKINNEKNFHKCPECGLFYNEKEWAEKCEKWCKENQSCNLDIISHAIKNN